MNSQEIFLKLRTLCAIGGAVAIQHHHAIRARLARDGFERLRDERLAVEHGDGDDDLNSRTRAEQFENRCQTSSRFYHTVFINIYPSNTADIPVFILCGGLRHASLRKKPSFRPGFMVLIGEHPILWHVMQKYARHGFRRFVLCLGFKADVVKDYFNNFLPRTTTTAPFSLKDQPKSKVHESPAWISTGKSRSAFYRRKKQ